MKPNNLSVNFKNNFKHGHLLNLLVKSTSFLTLLTVSTLPHWFFPEQAWSKSIKKSNPMTPHESRKNVNAELLWDAWYTITVEKKGEKPFNYAYYQDKVERKDGRFIFFNKLWKKEDQYINEESLGAFAKDDTELTPLFFDFYSKYRQTETKIHGEVDEKRYLSVKGTRGSQIVPEVKNKPLPKGIILSALFPVWIKTRIKELRPLKSVTFLTIFEDNLELAYSPVVGHVTLAKADDFARTTQVKKIEVEYDSRKSTWYIDEEGVATRIEMHSLNAVVEKTSEAKAKLFLK